MTTQNEEWEQRFKEEFISYEDIDAKYEEIKSFIEGNFILKSKVAEVLEELKGQRLKYIKESAARKELNTEFDIALNTVKEKLIG